MKKEKQAPVVVKLSKNAGIKSTENLRVYVVNSGGQIVESASFKGDEATLTSSRTSLEGKNKVYIAQAMPEEMKASANELSLLKMKAYDAVKEFDGNSLSINYLPNIIIDPFPFHRCLVTGHVNKNFIINGVSENLALCDMRVHICNVETEFRWPYFPIYYRRIPDWVLQEIAEKVINLQPIPKPKDPIGPISFTKVSRPLSSLTANSLFKKAATAKPSVALPENVLNSLSSGSADIIRQTMINYHDLLFPYLCYWPIYWPWIYISDELSVVTTDCNGHFQALEFIFGNQHLNIYIWIEAFINGQWVTVYRPPLPCYTHWSYPCNTDINITITDPRVSPCNCGTDGPADAVWFRSIGQSASALHIAQSISGTVAVQGSSISNVGCTDVINLPFLTAQPGGPVSPFGAGLTFKLFCGADIFAAGVTHYRWKYTNIYDANLNPIPPAFQVTTIIPGAVLRPYLVKLSATSYETHYAPLGAVGTAPDIAYHIPHQNIVDETLIPASDQLLSPTWEDIFFDSAYLDSTKLTDGLYRFDLELLKQNGSGSFTVVPVARPTFQVSKANSILDSQDAPDNYLLPQNPLLQAHSLSFNVRIENAICTADIHDASLVETGALSGPCGFIKYTEVSQHVHLSFEASQPQNFATFNYALIKGNNTVPTGINPQGYVISSVDGFTLSGGLFSDDFTVESLLNGCIGQAAFSENLYVAAMATDGTNRLNGYDRSDVNAFALSNT
ncbi:MAG TPA: hypothetical protein VGN20_01385 [Mucilaginibacter sp.]|jgi:hypothetical protein